MDCRHKASFFDRSDPHRTPTDRRTLLIFPPECNHQTSMGWGHKDSVHKRGLIRTSNIDKFTPLTQKPSVPVNGAVQRQMCFPFSETQLPPLAQGLFIHPSNLNRRSPSARTFARKFSSETDTFAIQWHYSLIINLVHRKFLSPKKQTFLEDQKSK